MTRSMVLPPHDPALGGEIVRDNPGGWRRRSADDRVPGALRDRRGDTDHEPRVLDAHRRADQCPDGRHLWDVIERISETELDLERDEDAYGWDRRHAEDCYEYDFRAVLTCVHCGTIREWEGSRRERPARQVNPIPIGAGNLVAQQVRDHGHGMDEWTIYRDGARVGVLAWARGARGRRFHQARLDAWPAGEVVEGKDPTAALRALVRRRTPAAREASA